MAKSSRSSSVKKNNQKLKKNLFGPAETARNERMSAKLLELAGQPKTHMEIEKTDNDDAADSDAKEEDKATQDVDMDGNAAATRTKKPERSYRQIERERDAKKARIEKRKAPRKARNSRTFDKPTKAPKRGGR